MKFTTSTIFTAALVATVSAAPLSRRAVDPALVPDVGLEAGINPDGAGNCDGINGIKIPCSCPPDRQTILNQLNANLDAGRVVNNPDVPPLVFPTGNTPQDESARITAVLITLQNLEGPGKGCPAAATTLLAKQKELNGQATGAAAQPAPEPVPVNNAGNNEAAADPAANAVGGVDPALVPDVGLEAGINPDGAGNCDGVNGVKIPCSCPPDRQTILTQLNANLNAGRVVNNPNVPPLVFPTGDSPQDESARITAVLITLQNLEGPGVGCPAAATTLLAKQKALTG